MKDIDVANEEYVEAQIADVEQFLAETRWSDAQAVIDNLYETGFEDAATELRKKLLNAQVAWAEMTEGERQLVTMIRELNSSLQELLDVLRETSELNPNRGDAPY